MVESQKSQGVCPYKPGSPNGRFPWIALRRKLAVPSQGRLYYLRYALKMGWTIEQIHELTNIDPWFLAQMKELDGF